MSAFLPERYVTKSPKALKTLMADKELKTIKFQMMLSESEAEAIDDWSFKLRIRSRAEAIRRLCQIGLRADENVGSVLKLSEKAFTNRVDDAKVLIGYLQEDPSSLDILDVRLAAAEIGKSAMDDHVELNESIMHLSEPIIAIRNAKTPEEAIADAETAKERLTEMISDIKANAARGSKKR